MKKSVALLVKETAAHGFSRLLGPQPMNAAVAPANCRQWLRQKLNDSWRRNLSNVFNELADDQKRWPACVKALRCISLPS